jgi:hypothetical protein
MTLTVDLSLASTFSESLDHKHAVTVTVKAIARLNCVAVSIKRQTVTGEGANQHQE